jgi:hypothetical protein
MKGVAKNIKPPQSFKEVIDVLIGEVALTRRKIESLLEVLDEKGLISQEEFKNKLKEKSEKEKLEILIESLSLNSKEK